MRIRDQDALDYHAGKRSGKLQVIATKPCRTQRDLSLAYTPGVAVPCRRIEQNRDEVYRYTARGNLVAVVSNGTAVLGLGDIGAAAAKPVMEGKGVLFKRFADIDVFDLELDTHDPDRIISAVQLLEPTFGGINLEDIKAPECFYIEETLKKRMSIPVFHDDQHGTAIISGAALLNALEIAGKKIEAVRVVFNGAGAAGIACARFYLSLGVRRENLVLCDSRGVIYRGRETRMNPYKAELAADTDARTLADVMEGADVFVGLSITNCVSKDMLRSMAERPIVFAMANPDPEIGYEEARAARPDVIMATGRSDCPNQVDNVLGFPFIFRGALDVRATAINEPMKLAATRALAALAKEDVPDSVVKAYGLERLHLGPEYLLPKPFDQRVLIWGASAVAQAAMESGVAQRRLDLEEYRETLESRLGKTHEVARMMIHQAQRNPQRLVFPEGENEKVLRGTQIILDEGFARPILLGREAVIRGLIAEHDLHLDDVTVIDPDRSELREGYIQRLYRTRRRKGVTLLDARMMMRNPTVFGAMMVDKADADAMVVGITQHYPDALRPSLQILGTRDDVKRVAGLHIMMVRDRVYFFADTTVNIEPDAETLAEIAILSAETARRFNVEPRVAMLSFSNFGSAKHSSVDAVRRAVSLVRDRAPGLVIDGELQARTAVWPELISEIYPFSSLGGGANVLVFGNLLAANTSYQLLERLGGAEAIGPILMGMAKPVHLLQIGSEVEDVVNMAAIAAVDAQDARRASQRVPQLIRTA